MPCNRAFHHDLVIRVISLNSPPIIRYFFPGRVRTIAAATNPAELSRRDHSHVRITGNDCVSGFTRC